MSETDNQAISVLLPQAAVAVFSRDQETLRAAHALEKDWRFARVKIQAGEGDTMAAASAYKEVQSPDLVIVQTDTIDDSFTAQLEDLAGSCHESTAAIVIGPVNDVYLYRRLIEMGVSDYLVKPIEFDVLANVIAKTLIDRMGVMESRLIAFIGAKGGVGTSALVQGAAFGISSVLEQKTALIDAAGGWSVLSVGMGFEPITTLPEAAKAALSHNEDNLKRMLFAANDKLDVLASGGDVMLENQISGEQMEPLIDMLMAKYPVVLADLSQAGPALSNTILTRANQIVVISTPMLPSLRLARSLVQEIKELRGGKISDVELVINMQGAAPANEVAKSDIEKAMEMKVSTFVPYAPKVFMGCESQSKPLTDDKEGDVIVRTHILPILQKVLSVESSEYEAATPASEGLLGGILKRLKS